MIQAYLKHVEKRGKEGLPPLPLDAEQTRQVCALLKDPPEEHKDLLLNLFQD